MDVGQEIVYSKQGVEQFHRVHHHFTFDNLLLPGIVQFLCVHVRLKVALLLPPRRGLCVFFEVIGQFLVLAIDYLRKVSQQRQEPIPFGLPMRVLIEAVKALESPFRMTISLPRIKRLS